MRASVDSQGENGLIWKRLQTAGISVRKKMVRDYASKERRKEKEASEESKTAKREAARYRETSSEVAEESLDGFSEEIKGKAKRERVLKEQRKKVPDYRLAMKVMAWYMEPVSVSEVLHLP